MSNVKLKRLKIDQYFTTHLSCDADALLHAIERTHAAPTLPSSA